MGASASAHLGYPLGRGLKQKIINITEPNNRRERKHMNDFGFEDPYIDGFRNILSQSPRPSIDWFLEDNQDYMEIGKFFIAQALIPFENEIRWSGRNETRYEFIFNKIISDFDRISENKAGFITFNYDRSLEYYFFNSILNTFGLECELRHKTAIDAMRFIEIIHVHGSLGDLPWQDADGKGRQYQPNLNSEIITNSASSIRVVSESTLDDPSFVRARTLIEEANSVHILGLGYNHDNMTRLGFPYGGNRNKFCGTTMGLTDLARKETANKYKVSNSRISQSLDVLGYLKNHPLYRG